VSDAADQRIIMTLACFSWDTTNGAEAEARIASYQAPPSKAAILVCRQLRMEMSNMQVAAFRRCWDESTFHICEDDMAFLNRFCVGPDRDMQHVKHFIFHVRCVNEMIEVELHFRAGKWAASFYVSDQLWSVSTMFQQFGVPAPQGLQPGLGFQEEMRQRSASGAFSGERETMDPESGLGFTAVDLCLARRVIDHSIVDWVFL